MDAGLLVHLNPQGGNQLNVREVLRLLHPVAEESSDDDSAGDEPQEDGRRGAGDDYDYDDDFIDDDDLVEEDIPPVDDHYDENADEDFVLSQSASEDAPHDAAATERSQKQKAMQATTIHHGFGRFFVNRGNIPSLAKLKPPPNPSTPVGNVTVQLPRVPEQPKPVEQGDSIEEDQEKPKVGEKKSDSPLVQEEGNGNGSVTLAHKKKASEGVVVSTALKGKGIPLRVATEITTLAELCRTEFGEKKPKIQDPKVQDQLAVVFREALAAGVARLFSDIAKDKRIVQLSDDVWVRLSRFLRTKRATLETLGHALHWRAREIDAKRRVEAAEQAIDTVVEAQRAGWMAADSGQNAPERLMEWTRSLDECMYEWYSARSEFQTSKNQLGVRVRSIKKALPTWVSALKTRSFSGFTMSEQEIIDAFRRIEDERAAKERLKRELERLERKRKKEEATAVVAAKRQATASAKSAQPGSVAGTVTNSSTTTSSQSKIKASTPPPKNKATTPPKNKATTPPPKNKAATPLAKGTTATLPMKGTGATTPMKSAANTLPSKNTPAAPTPKPPLPKAAKPTNIKNLPKPAPVKATKPGSRQGSPTASIQKQAKLTSLIKKPSKDGGGVTKRVTPTKQASSGGTGSASSKNSPVASANPKNNSSTSLTTNSKVTKQAGAGFKSAGYTKPVLTVRSAAGLKPPNPTKIPVQDKVQKGGRSPGAKTSTPVKSSGKNVLGKNTVTKGAPPQAKSVSNKSPSNKAISKKPVDSKPVTSKQATAKPAVVKTFPAKANVIKPVTTKLTPSKSAMAKGVSDVKSEPPFNKNNTNTSGDTKLASNPESANEPKAGSAAVNPSTALKHMSGPKEAAPVQQSSKAHAVSVAQLVLQDELEEAKPNAVEVKRDGGEGSRDSREFEVIELD